MYVSIETNSVDPDQTAPIRAVGSGSTLFDKEASKTFQQTTKANDIRNTIYTEADTLL